MGTCCCQFDLINETVQVDLPKTNKKDLTVTFQSEKTTDVVQIDPTLHSISIIPNSLEPVVPPFILQQINTLCYTKIALKLPHGTNAVQYNEDKKIFESCDINEWLSILYKDKTWTSWIVYNDETKHLGDIHTAKGHCKGIIAWNATHLSWLVHSVPNFPREFTGHSISSIEPEEHIYGQSFFHITRQADDIFVKQVIGQLYNMAPHIFMKHNIPDVEHTKQMISTVVFSDEIQHIAKSPHHEIDIYSDCLDTYASEWYVETWKRGHAIISSNNIKDVSDLCVNGQKYKESQDHSKWATSEQYYWIGDLNRMTSQYKRGGGGFLVKHQVIAQLFRSFILLHE